MNATIEIDGLRKRFGSTQALDGMTFTVVPGRVTGFAGPNGAGKSTTMRVILGLDTPDAGAATIGGRPYRSLENPLRHVGSLLAAEALQPGRSARNHLLWLAHSQGLKWVAPLIRRGFVSEACEVDGAGGVEGFLGRAGRCPGEQDGVFVAFPGGGVDREPEGMG